MKKTYSSISIAIALAVAAFAVTTQAADKEVTIKGEGMCAKCELKEAKSCQNAVKVKDGDKTVVYYLEHNDVSKAFHKNVCSSTAKVVAKGTVKEVDGKKQFVATKIDLDK